MPNLTIRTRIMLAVLVAVIISSSIVTYSSYRNARNSLIDRLDNKEMPVLVKSIRNSINDEINQMKIVARSLAENPVFKNWSQQGADPDMEKLVVEHLGNIVKANGFSNASFVDRETAQYWNQDGFLRVLSPDRDKWFFGFKDSGNSELSSVYRSTTSDKVDIFVNYQEVNGRGLSGVSKSFKEMVNELNAFKLEESGFVYLVDADGLVKVHRDDKLNDTKTLVQIHPELASHALLSKQDYASTTTQDLVISSSYIESLGWYVIAEVPKAELLADVDKSAYEMIFYLVITSSFFAILSYFTAASLTTPINNMAARFAVLGEGGGDLTSRVPEDSAPEINELAKGFNAFVTNIQNVVKDVVETSASVQNASCNVNSDVEVSKVALDKQRDEAHQVSVAITEMGSTVAEIADNANVAAQTTNNAANQATNAQTIVNDSTLAINQMAEEMETVASNIESLAEKSNNISGVLDVIRGISEQTNLLALNAAIEAARAGEHGRGFAVVADEVRSLAQRTSESTEEIDQMISELQAGAENAVSSVSESKKQAIISVESAQATNTALQEIVGNVMHISDLNTQIATATEEQSVVSKEINVHVVSISDSSEQSAQSIASIKNTSDQMQDTSTHLNNLVSKFKV